jgi:hypothetical protein
MGGRLVELAIYRGSHAGKKTQLGAVSFDPAEWEDFRTFLVGGMRAAAHARIPIEFMDGTRQQPSFSPAKNVH